MIILGIDPGTLITGISIIEIERSAVTMFAYDIVKNSSNDSMPIRLQHIYSKLCEFIDLYHPDECAIETAFYGKNAQSALKIGHARGVSILAAVNHEIPTTEYSPREIKKAVTGNGAASKQQVQYMVKTQLKLKETPKYLDASDSLAIALCHFYRLQHQNKFVGRSQPGKKISKNWSAFVEAHPERILRVR